MSRSNQPQFLVFLLSVLAMGVAACSSDAASGPPIQNVTTAPVTLVSVAVNPPLLTLPVGAHAQLVANGQMSDASLQDLTASVQWSSDTPGVATVAGGVVTSLAAGTATIQARTGTLSAACVVTVPQSPVQSLALTPSQATTGIGGQVAFKAIATFADKSEADVSQSVVWTVDNAGVASVDSNGMAHGVGAGKAVIQAALGTTTATATLTVSGGQVVSLLINPVNPSLNIGTAVAFSAVASYQDGSVAPVGATWSSSAADIVAIASDTGVASAMATGTSIVSASYGGITAKTTVTVEAATLTSLAILPNPAQVAIGGAVSFQATGTYSDKTTADLTLAASWSSSAPAVAVVDNAPGHAGLATGLVAGDATITAVLGGVQAQVKLTVTNVTLQAIAISPANGSVPKGASLAMSAKGTYSDGSIVDLTQQVAWGTADGTIATISNAGKQAGLLLGLAVGKTQVTAALGAVTSQTDVAITLATLASIAVTPAAPTLAVGSMQNFVATGTYSDQTTADLTAQAVWTTSDPTIATVSNAAGSQGQLSALGAGQTDVAATYAGVVGHATATVSAPQLTGLTVGPLNPSHHAGQKIQFFAMASFSNGVTQNVTTNATWTVSDTGVAILGATGLVTAGTPGSATITASYSGQTASTTLTVTSPELLEIQVTPLTTSIAAGGTVSLQATAIFTDNTSQNITGQSSWSTSDATLATVSTASSGKGGFGGGKGGGQGGRVSTLEPGSVTITASYNGLTANATVTITAASIVAIVVTPGASSVAVGQTRNLTAQAIYSDNTAKDVTAQSTWLSSTPLVAAIDAGGGGGGFGGFGGGGFGGGGGAAGLATALSPGDTVMTANYQGLSGSASFHVTAATVTGLQIAPGVATVAKGLTVHFGVTAIYSDNTTLDVTNQATFLSSNEQLVDVSDAGGTKGTAQALAAGTVTITAGWQGQTATATLVVSDATVTGVQVTPTQPSVAKGTFVKFTAFALLSDNTSLDVTNAATWQSSNASVAWIDAGNGGGAGGKGSAQAVGTGSATISASWQGVSGTTQLIVTTAGLTTIQVTPFTPTIPIGYTTQFQATGVFSDNSTEDLTAQVSWISTVPAVGTVVASGEQRGVFTPVSGGSTQLEATWQGMTGACAVTVTAAKLQTLTVTPASPTIGLGLTQQFTAMGLFDSGLQLDLSDYVTWLSDDDAVVSISNASGTRGQAKAVAVGATNLRAVHDAITGETAVTVTKP